MTISAPGTLAVELHPHSPTHWIAIYYPMVVTPAGRWADVTWTLHQHLVPVTADPRGPARWLEACSPDPDHPCYTGHPAGAIQLAAGYATARAVHEAETTEAPLPDQEARLLRDGTFVIPAGQLSEWVLEDLEDETSDIRG
jgi:hypothetical protein